MSQRIIPALPFAPGSDGSRGPLDFPRGPGRLESALLTQKCAGAARHPGGAWHASHANYSIRMTKETRP